jgi:phosphate transport system substrate-binding protein
VFNETTGPSDHEEGQMKLRTGRKAAALAVTLAMAGGGLAACAANEQDNNNTSSGPAGARLEGTINGGGASSQSAAQEAWRGGFVTLQPDVTVNYDPVGSGAGREQFAEGGLSFVGSDAPFSAEEAAGGLGACSDGSDLVEVPVYISPIVVGFNLEGVDQLNLAPATIADIFLGKIAKWNDAAIKADNPDAALPDLAITPVHRSDKSGTTGNFTEYLEAVAPKAWPHEASEEWPVSGGEAAEKTQGVVATVAATPGAVGYIDAGQAGDLGWASIKVGGVWVKPSADGAAKAVSESTLETGRAASDVVYELNRTTEAEGAYPLLLVSYLVACQKYDDPKTAELVAAYASYVTSEDGQSAAAKNSGSAPLTSQESLSQKVSAAVGAIGS